MLRVWAGSPILNAHTSKALVADLRAGASGKGGSVSRARRPPSISCRAPCLPACAPCSKDARVSKHPSNVAALVLRGLSVDPGEADAIARRPLPALH
jgi:hypothetical protein